MTVRNVVLVVLCSVENMKAYSGVFVCCEILPVINTPIVLEEFLLTSVGQTLVASSASSLLVLVSLSRKFYQNCIVLVCP